MLWLINAPAATAMVFTDLVSRRITASVDRHCGANTYQASSDSAVASGHCAAIRGCNWPAAWSAPAVKTGSEYVGPCVGIS